MSDIKTKIGVTFTFNPKSSDHIYSIFTSDVVPTKETFVGDDADYGKGIKYGLASKEGKLGAVNLDEQKFIVGSEPYKDYNKQVKAGGLMYTHDYEGGK